MSTDRIHLGDVIKQTPRLIARIPNFIKAGRILNPLRHHTSLGSVIEDSARRYPDNPAIFYQDRRYTYKEFNAQANRVAHFLIQQGVKKGDVVALFMENRPEFLFCAVGIAKVGAVAALINTSQTGKVLSHSINLVKPVAAIVAEELVAPLDAVRGDLELPTDAFYFMADRDTTRDFGAEPAGYQNLARILAGMSDANPPTTATVTKSDFLFYIYTSGTTGMPKASITNHERWLAAHAGFGHVISGMRPDDIFYLTLPLYHATGLLVCWGAIVSGPAAVVIRRRFSASEFWKDIHHYRCTGFGYVGELCRYLLNRPPQDDDAHNTVRMMIGNGLRPTIWKEFRQRFAIDNIYEFYASSEGNVAFLNIFNMDNTIGFGGGNIALVKYDKEAEQPVRNAEGYLIPADDGEPGLLLGKITKATPFVGYTQKEKTEAAILRNVFTQGDAYFNTGDLIRHIGCRHYQFVDRTGDTFRWKGENVSTTELESILSSHPHIEEAVVYGVQIPNTDGRAGMAAITPSIPESEIDFKALLAFARKELPHYAVPVFLRLREQMETTGTFKYKKTDLKSDGFDVNKVSDPLYVWLPGTDTYTLLTLPIYQAIQNGEYRY